MTSTNAMLSKYRNMLNKNKINENNSNNQIQNEPEKINHEKKKDDKINEEKPFVEIPKNRPSISNLLQKFEKKGSKESCGILNENIDKTNKNDENQEKPDRKSSIDIKLGTRVSVYNRSEKILKYNDKSINETNLDHIPLKKYKSIEGIKSDLNNKSTNKPSNEPKLEIPELKERKSVHDLIKLNEKRLKDSSHRNSSGQKEESKLHTNFEIIDRSKYRNTMADNFTKVSEIKYFLKLLKEEKNKLNDEDTVHVKDLISYYETKLQTRSRSCLEINKKRNTANEVALKSGNNMKVSVIKEEEEDENSKNNSRKNFFLI